VCLSHGIIAAFKFVKGAEMKDEFWNGFCNGILIGMLVAFAIVAIVEII
jgi:hypothetical protein